MKNEYIMSKLKYINIKNRVSEVHAHNNTNFSKKILYVNNNVGRGTVNEKEHNDENVLKINDLKVDYVFPYVDSADLEWQEEYKKYYALDSLSSERFRPLGFLKYIFRGIAENMPWVNEVVFIVSSKSQIPEWLDTNNDKIRIITHDEFIPKKYLPTFNSNTIEMFLSDIPGLSEYLIYGNDDFIPLSNMKIGNYFTSNGLPRISYRMTNNVNSEFRKMCKRNWDMNVKLFPLKKLYAGYYFRQYHESQPITLSLLKEASKIFKKDMLESITRKRDNHKNLSQYIYYDYMIASGKCARRGPYFSYNELLGKKLKKIIKEIDERKHKWICLNDTAHANMNIIDSILIAFNNRYPNKCIYEK